MRADNLWEWLREHWANEAAAEAEEEGDMSEPEGRERGTKDRREYGGEGRYQKKW